MHCDGGYCVIICENGIMGHRTYLIVWNPVLVPFHDSVSGCAHSHDGAAWFLHRLHICRHVIILVSGLLMSPF